MLTSMLSTLAVAATLCATGFAATALPIVDVGYAVHQATLNSSGINSYYNFSNIRYGQAPIGNLRFSAPLAPTGRNATVNDGQQGAVCAQADPEWINAAPAFISTYLTGGNVSSYDSPSFIASSLDPSFNISSIPAPDPQTTEDCLFLDVMVPASIFYNMTGPYNVTCDASGTGEPCKEVEGGTGGAAVVVWIYGGGFTTGSKNAEFPAGLIASSLVNGSEGVVYVAMNYRLGIFGWLSGTDNITLNAGLLDQRLALDWVKENIHLFGGDPNRITVMGESAGASSLMHHITSYGGNKSHPLPFQQAIPQSPAFQVFTPEQQTQQFLTTSGNITERLGSNYSFSSTADLRAMNYEDLVLINNVIVGISEWGTFTYTPCIDVSSPNSYVPDVPARLLTEGKHHNVSVLVGHNSNEGLLFTQPFAQTQSLFSLVLSTAFPTANRSLIAYIDETLYPPIYDGSRGYLNPIGRAAQTIADFAVNCNAYAIASTFASLPGLSAYAYIFPLGSGLHGSDVPYTFFNGVSNVSDDGYDVFPRVALAMQRYLTEFVMTGAPSAAAYGLLAFERYGENGTVTDIDVTGLGRRERDPALGGHCAFWNAAPYYPNPLS